MSAEPDFQALYGKAVHELRTLREKQAKLRSEVRYLKDRVTGMRSAAKDALEHIEAGDPGAAAELLKDALAPSPSPDADHVPAGARNRRRARQQP